MLGRGYREFTQHYPAARLGRARPGGDLPRLASRRCAEALAGRPASGRPASASPTSGRRSCCGTGEPSRPVAPAIVWQDRRTSARCRELREAGLEPLLRERTGLVADPYFSATKLEWLLRDPDAAPPRRAGRAGGRDGGELARRAAHRRPGPRERPHQRLAHAALRPAQPATGIRSCSRSSASRASCCPPSCRSAGVVGETDAAHLGFPLADRRARRRPAGRAVRPGLLPSRAWPRTPTAPARSSWCYHGRPAAAPPDGRAGHRRLRSARRAGLRARGERVHRRARRSSGSGTGSGSSATPARPRRWPGACRTPAGSTSSPRSSGSARRTGSRRRGARSPGSPAGTTRAHLVRAALEAIAFSSAELLEAMAGGGRARGAGAPGGRRRGRQRLADAVPGRRARAFRWSGPTWWRRRRSAPPASPGIALGVWTVRAEFLAGRRFHRFEPRHERRGAARAAGRAGSGRSDAALAWARGPATLNPTGRGVELSAPRADARSPEAVHESRSQVPARRRADRRQRRAS